MTENAMATIAAPANTYSPALSRKYLDTDLRLRLLFAYAFWIIRDNIFVSRTENRLR